MVLTTASCTMSWTSIHSSSGTLSDLIPWIYLSLPLYNHKGFDLGHTWMDYIHTTNYSSGFPYFLQFQSEFVNKEFMIWATVSSWSCFCWLYRASPSCCKEHNQSDFGVDHLVMSMCRFLFCLLFSFLFLFAMSSAFSWQNSINLCPASSVLQAQISNLPAIPGISQLPTFAFQSPTMKRTSFFGCEL